MESAIPRRTSTESILQPLLGANIGLEHTLEEPSVFAAQGRGRRKGGLGQGKEALFGFLKTGAQTQALGWGVSPGNKGSNGP